MYIDIVQREKRRRKTPNIYKRVVCLIPYRVPYHHSSHHCVAAAEREASPLTGRVLLRVVAGDLGYCHTLVRVHTE